MEDNQSKFGNASRSKKEFKKREKKKKKGKKPHKNCSNE